MSLATVIGPKVSSWSKQAYRLYLEFYHWSWEWATHISVWVAKLDLCELNVLFSKEIFVVKWVNISQIWRLKFKMISVLCLHVVHMKGWGECTEGERAERKGEVGRERGGRQGNRTQVSECGALSAWTQLLATLRFLKHSHGKEWRFLNERKLIFTLFLKA